MLTSETIALAIETLESAYYVASCVDDVYSLRMKEINAALAELSELAELAREPAMALERRPRPAGTA